jgi:uncharacterized membrane protein YjdF
MSFSNTPSGQSREPLTLLVLTISTLIISGLGPFDRTTWVLEVFPILIGLPLLITFYSVCPSADWILGSRDLCFSRNHYDRFGHLAQGFNPAILTREILLRRSPVENGCALSPPVYVLRLALYMNSLNGGPLSLVRKRGGISWYAGRCVGYALGHVSSFAWSPELSSVARPAT